MKKFFVVLYFVEDDESYGFTDTSIRYSTTKEQALYEAIRDVSGTTKTPLVSFKVYGEVLSSD